MINLKTYLERIERQISDCLAHKRRIVMEVWPTLRRNTTLRKLVSLLVAVSFIFSNIAFAEPQKDQSVLSPNNIVIEKEHGLVKSKFLGNSNKLIINIQDAHCNYEAQTNIINILETLIKNHNLSLISVEGADGLIDTTWFKAFPDEEVRKEVATYFMKKGEITGPEFLSITQNYPIKLFGAEDRTAYIQNLNAFTSSYPLKAETEKYYNSIKAALNRLKGYIYSDDLKIMDTKSQDYDSKKIQFNDYIRFLQEMAEKKKINLRSYENLFRLVSVLIYEKKIDFKVTDQERAVLIDELSKILSKDALTELVSQSIAFKSGKISSVEFYAFLKKDALDNNIDLAKKYPNLYNYIIYNSVYSKIDNEKLFQEIKIVETDIKEKVFANDDQRTLDKLSRHIDILVGMVNIKLLNGDFNYYQTHKDEFTHEAFTGFIKKKGEAFGLAYDVELPSEAVAKSVPRLEEFYVIATKRDRALVENTLKEMDKEKQSIAVLVTGGFHSEGMARFLEKQGVSYIVVCPSITKDTPTPYIQILTNQRTPIEDILTSPDAAKKGMLAPISLAELVPMTPAEIARFLSGTPLTDPEIKSLINEIIDRADEVKKSWVSVSAVRWLARALPAARNHEFSRKEKNMKDAYVYAMYLGLKKYLTDSGKSEAEAARTAKKIVDAIIKFEDFGRIFTKSFNRIAPRIESLDAIGGNGGAAPDRSIREKSTGSSFRDNAIDAVLKPILEGKEGKAVLVLDDGKVAKEYADVIKIIRTTIENMPDSVFADILKNRHVYDPDLPLSSIFNKVNLLKMFEKGSGFKLWLVQPKDKDGVPIPGILMTDSGANFGHYSPKERNNCAYLPLGLTNILLTKGEDGRKKLAANYAHEIVECMVLSALVDALKLNGKVRAEHPTVPPLDKEDRRAYDIGKTAHNIAQLFERAIAGPADPNSKYVLALGLPSTLDEELFSIWREYLAAVEKKASTSSPLLTFRLIGEQIWLDGLTYDMLQVKEGDFISEFEALVRDHGITGVTTNPSLIKAYLKSPKVQGIAARLAARGMSPEEVYFELIKGLANEVVAAFGRQNVKGKFSVELNPLKADNVEESVAEAMKWLAIAPENIMVKVAANEAGYKIIEEVTYRGGNVNATLIFAPGQYRKVALAYIAGLAKRAAEGKKIDNIYSVASFFVSRWDTACAQYIPEDHPEYHGMFANSVAITAYNEIFTELFLNPNSQFQRELAVPNGAKAQDFLLASTGSKAADIAKNLAEAGMPASVVEEIKKRYSAGVYVTPVQGPYVVNTLPLPTINYLMTQETKPEKTIETNREIAREIFNTVEASMTAKTAEESKPGLNIEAKGEELFKAGMEQFKTAFNEIMATIESIVLTERAKAVNLSPFAGLPIILNSETGELILGESIISEPKWTRALAEVGTSIRNPEAITSANRDKVIYYGYMNVALKENGTTVVDNNHLRLDVMVLMPGVVAEGDEEFIMTKGYNYPPLTRREETKKGEPVRVSLPEFSEVWNGYAMHIQQGMNPNTQRFEVEVTFVKPGDKVLLKPGYSQRTVNIGNEPLVIANLLGEEAGGKNERVEGEERYNAARDVEGVIAPSVRPSFSEIEANRGYAYWALRSRAGGIRFRFNPRYSPGENLQYAPYRAALRFATPASEIPELGLSNNEPMYRQAGNKALSDFLRGSARPETYQRLVKASYTPEGVKNFERKIQGALTSVSVTVPLPSFEGVPSEQLKWVPGYEGDKVRLIGTSREWSRDVRTGEWIKQAFSGELPAGYKNDEDVELGNTVADTGIPASGMTTANGMITEAPHAEVPEPASVAAAARPDMNGANAENPVPMQVRGAAGLAEQPEPGEMTAKAITAAITEPSVAYLAATEDRLIGSKGTLVPEGKVLTIYIKNSKNNTATDFVAQAIDDKISEQLEGLVINKRVTLDKAVETAKAVMATNNIRAIVTINEDGKLNTTAVGQEIYKELLGLKPDGKSRILDIQTNNDAKLFASIPAIYDLALRLGFDQGIDPDFAAFLRGIGLFYDAGGERLDPLAISTQLVIRIIPTARAAAINADAAQAEAAKVVYRSL